MPEKPHWEKKFAHAEGGFTPLEEFGDPDGLTPEEVMLLEEKLRDPKLKLSEEERDLTEKTVLKHRGDIMKEGQRDAA